VFGGALYLFTINTIFIALSSFVVAKLLRFPLVKYANQARRKKTMRIAYVIGIIAVTPSIILFVFLLKEQLFMNEVNKFIEDRVKHEGMAISVVEQDYEQKKIGVFMVGQRVPQSVINVWRKDFAENPKLEGATIIFQQGEEAEKRDPSQIEAAYIDNLKVVASKDERIAALQEELSKLRSSVNAFDRLKEEIKLNYPRLSSISYAPSQFHDFIAKKTDTISIFNVTWSDTTLAEQEKRVLEYQMGNWLKFRLQEDTVIVKEIQSNRVKSNPSN
jgi:hypothetical protein